MMALLLPPHADEGFPLHADADESNHLSLHIYPRRPPPPQPCAPAPVWRPHPAILARAPPFPFRAEAGPVVGSFWVLPGLLVVGPDPRWERRGAVECLAAFRIAEAVTDDVIVLARNLAPHLIDGPPLYVCGRGSRALACYLLAELYDLPLALAVVDVERLGAMWAAPYLRASEWRALLRALAGADRADASAGGASSCTDSSWADDADDGLVRAAFDAGVARQRSAWYARNVR